jgi:hypothetical protein
MRRLVTKHEGGYEEYLCSLKHTETQTKEEAK